MGISGSQQRQQAVCPGRGVCIPPWADMRMNARLAGVSWLPGLLWLLGLLFVLADVRLAAAADSARLLGMKVEPVQGGAQVVLEVSRAISFDAGVQVRPLRLEVLVPGLRAGGAKQAEEQAVGKSPLLGGVRLRSVPGGVLLSFPLRAPALIVNAHAEVAARGRKARLVVRLARTDAQTLARLLGVEVAALDDVAAPQRTGGKGEERGSAVPAVSPGNAPSGALDKVKAAYRRLVEEAAAAAAPSGISGIGALIEALPLGFGADDEGGREARAESRRAMVQQEQAGRQVASGQPQKHPAERAKEAEKPAGVRPVIVVDAGHGGRDPGAIGIGGVKEKDIVLRFALALRKALQARGYRVVMTREDDTFLRLRQRVQVARDNQAALFISIHADRFRRRGVGGLGIYTLSEEASDADAAALARKENAADLIGAPDDVVADGDVRDILVELTQRETNANSHLLATRLVEGLRGVARIRRNPVRSAAFRVLRAPEIPALLIELGFITNQQDVRNMRSAAWRRKVAARMAQTIDKVLKNRLALR